MLNKESVINDLWLFLLHRFTTLLPSYLQSVISNNGKVMYWKGSKETRCLVLCIFVAEPWLKISHRQIFFWENSIQMNIKYTLNFYKKKIIHVHIFVVWQLSTYRGKSLITKALVFALGNLRGTGETTKPVRTKERQTSITMVTSLLHKFFYITWIPWQKQWTIFYEVYHKNCNMYTIHLIKR